MSPKNWRGARVLVTGARGFIAARLCRRLIESGAVLYGVTTRARLEAVPGLEWLQSDLTSHAKAHEILNRSRPDVIFHLAGHVTGSQDLANVEPTFAANLTTTVHLLTAASEMGHVRLVLAGSMQEPGADDPTGIPCSPYAASKWACNAYARMFHALYGLPVVIARPMMVYGPGQWDANKLLPYVTTSLLNGVSPAISSGTRVMDWIYVDDVVDGLLTVATATEVSGLTIDLGSGVLTSIRDIVERLGSLTDPGIPVRFGAVADRPLEQVRAANVEETRRLIGWMATTTLEEGLRRTVAWFKQEWCSPKPV
jgi:UDP-glucose 4-epimerase